ncbi:hypothetical protein ASPVEDRAFT_333954 [Aspergillus versicolor CBS 583.65]|uniref:Uncharacterized protein n=1 Tax=Aspergillus versicolor CBS 583.65 TaxID=1036611 RepID=A0A1L9PYW2_ASPVE|nr:uncharacterized protein ASPVEDRAFT_333954 [Aspergillus versicolor CBS 583.65]OJJ06698.1 hypothetical protein ASPVEDRAFT_333954 [Aspergillus versicolor CBS 583.65]
MGTRHTLIRANYRRAVWSLACLSGFLQSRPLAVIVQSNPPRLRLYSQPLCDTHHPRLHPEAVVPRKSDASSRGQTQPMPTQSPEATSIHGDRRSLCRHQLCKAPGGPGSMSQMSLIAITLILDPILLRITCPGQSCP